MREIARLSVAGPLGEPFCAFCWREHAECRFLVQGQAGSAICGECVKTAVGLIAREALRRQQGAEPTGPA